MRLAHIMLAMAGLVSGFVLAGPIPAFSESVAAIHRQGADVRHHARPTIPVRATALAPEAFPFGSRGMVMPGREPRPQSDPPNVEGYYGGGDTGFRWEPYGWWGTTE